MFGLLNLDKPAGVTSRDVVNRVQRLVRPLKVGHAGTLDPLASGVLVVALGGATRLIEYVQRMPKTYRGTFLLGRTSDTEDIEGCVTEHEHPPQPTEAALRTLLPRFLGTIEQRPPAFSALKVAGRRAYDLARQGLPVELAPRPVEIHQLEIVAYSYPRLTLHIRCGSGTYVRSLGRDLAAAAGTGAVMCELRREAIGPFRVDDSWPADEVSLPAIQQRLQPAILALGDMPRIEAAGDDVQRLARGQTIAAGNHVDGAEAAAVSATGELLAVLARADAGWHPTRVFGIAAG